jgi:hypothetical protein
MSAMTRLAFVLVFFECKIHFLIGGLVGAGAASGVAMSRFDLRRDIRS